MMKYVDIVIGEDEAKEIAVRFLEQHYSVINVTKAAFEDGMWTVTVLISSLGTKLRKVLVDAKNSKVIDWYK